MASHAFRLTSACLQGQPCHTTTNIKGGANQRQMAFLSLKYSILESAFSPFDTANG
ncbi:MAG: hypothetical protein AB1631_06655 [Acidobacteriota bacterium]